MPDLERIDRGLFRICGCRCEFPRELGENVAREVGCLVGFMRAGFFLGFVDVCGFGRKELAKLKDVMGLGRIFIPVNYWLVIRPSNRRVRFYGASCHLKTGDFFGCEVGTRERWM